MIDSLHSALVQPDRSALVRNATRLCDIIEGIRLQSPAVRNFGDINLSTRGDFEKKT